MQYAPQYAAGQGPQAMGVSADTADRIKGAARPTLALLGLRAALPLLRFGFFKMYYAISPLPAVLSSAEDMEMLKTRQTLSSAFDGLASLLTMVALICFFVWFARVYGWIRAIRGETRFSTGLAIGGWFIPFANFVLPYMAVRDAVRRGANDENAVLVPLWWGGWLLAMVFQVVQSVQQASPGTLAGLGRSGHMLMFWGNIGAQIVAYGALYLIVKGLTRKAAG